MVDPARNEPTPYRGGQQSLIEHFEITGLHGFRNIALRSDYAATILIAPNGSGKTTLLGALDAFLRLELSRLRNLQFREIHCKIYDHGVMILTHKDIVDFFETPTDGEIFRWSRRINVEISSLIDFLSAQYTKARTNLRQISDNSVFSGILAAVDYSFTEARSVCDKLRTEMYSRVFNIENIYSTLDNVLMGADIVYLPTYRRVELALAPTKPSIPAKRSRVRSQFNVAGGLFTGDIQFGLADISERLSEMNQTILVDSNIGYRNISATIINELLDGTFEREAELVKDLPNSEELALFFSRLQEGRYVGQLYPVTIPNINAIYNANRASESTRFLNYFLSKLDTVINATHEIEAQVENFINICNRYLKSSEMSTAGASNPSIRIGGKELKLNKANLKVHVESVPAGRRIPLDALSSGEKQMISLFAKMLLYSGKKIVLIDEPELSLSLDWQRQILVDVLMSQNCRQLIAITHSPFVFDNELEPYARSIYLSDDMSKFGDESEYVELDLDIDIGAEK